MNIPRVNSGAHWYYIDEECPEVTGLNETTRQDYRDLGSIKRRAAVEGGVHQSRGTGPVPDAEIVGEFMAEEFCTKRARGKE